MLKYFVFFLVFIEDKEVDMDVVELFVYYGGLINFKELVDEKY